MSSFKDCWVVAYNTGAGEYSVPEFIPAERQSEGCFGGHGHTSYAQFNTEDEAEAWRKPLKEEAEENRYFRDFHERAEQRRITGEDGGNRDDPDEDPEYNRLLERRKARATAEKERVAALPNRW